MSGLEMKYFVLKPKGDDAYAVASRKAMLAYSVAIAPTNLELAESLLSWAKNERTNSGSDHRNRTEHRGTQR